MIARREGEDGAVEVNAVAGEGYLTIVDHASGFMVELDVDEARWLQALALPMALAELAKVPSEPSVTIRDASNDDGQIEGQLALG